MGRISKPKAGAKGGIHPKRAEDPRSGRGSPRHRDSTISKTLAPKHTRLPVPVSGKVTPVVDHTPTFDAATIPTLDSPPSTFSPRGQSMARVGKDKNGRVIPHTPSARTRKIVADMLALDHSEEEICIAMNIRPGQFKQYYGRESDAAKIQAHAAVGGLILRQAKKPGNFNYTKLYAKAKMGWRDGEGAAPPTSPLLIHIHS